MPAKESHCYRNLKISKNTHDSNLSDVNQKFLAVAEESIGGGSFVVLRLGQSGRVPADFPSVTGHRAAVTDLKWNPFNPQQIASSSDDGMVRIWTIPNGGLVHNLSKPLCELKSHTSRASYIKWHTIADNIIASAGADKRIIVWDAGYNRPITSFGGLANICQCITWGFYGQLLGCTNKDKNLRMYDVRAQKPIIEALGHSGVRSSKMSFLNDDRGLVTCGFSKYGSRQIALWDLRNMQKAVTADIVDSGSGVMNLHYDPDLQIVYLIGKGDGNFRYYEIMKSPPHFYYLSEYTSAHPQRAFCAMPKLGLDFSRNEIARIYKAYATGSIIEPISVIVPRKSEHFQTDIYPNTMDCVSTMTAEEWLAGENRPPQFVSIKELQRLALASSSNLMKHVAIKYDIGPDMQTQISPSSCSDVASIAEDVPDSAAPTAVKASSDEERVDNAITRRHCNPHDFLCSPLMKRNSVLENVKRLEETIKRFNEGVYSPSAQQIVDGFCSHSGGQETSGRSRKVKEITQVFERDSQAMQMDGNGEGQIKRSKSNRGSSSMLNDVSEQQLKSKKEVKFREREGTSSGQAVNSHRVSSSEGRHRGRDSHNPSSKSIDKIDLQDEAVLVGYAATMNEGGVNANENNSSATHQGQRMTDANRQSWRHSAANRSSNSDQQEQHHFMLPAHKPDKVNFDNWRTVKELSKRLVMHEERIRQLEAKMNEFVTTG